MSATPSPETAPADAVQPYAPVIFVMIDGLRPDALGAGTPHLNALRARGASTLTAASVMPCITLPCHMSIFHSVPPGRHGITTNAYQPMARPLPGLLDQAKAHGKRCGAIYNWEPLRDVGRPEVLEFAWFRNSAYQHNGDDLVTEAAIRHIRKDRPDFAFVYLGTVDTAGHYYGWMSEGYLAQAARVDANLGRLLASLPETAHVLVHADHGGHERNHGTDTPEDMTIPWMLAGPRVKSGYTIEGLVSLLDTAPTLAELLGIPAHQQWEGRCVREAFQG
jgi:predicted AlkP superfamily pyrophosphatase or phosphodiesterase